jgi:hypothetical protein
MEHVRQGSPHPGYGPPFPHRLRRLRTEARAERRIGQERKRTGHPALLHRDPISTATRRDAHPQRFAASQARPVAVLGTGRCGTTFCRHHQQTRRFGHATGSAFPPGYRPGQCPRRRSRSACASPSGIPPRPPHPEIPRGQARSSGRRGQPRHERAGSRPHPSHPRSLGSFFLRP